MSKNEKSSKLTSAEALAKAFEVKKPKPKPNK